MQNSLESPVHLGLLVNGKRVELNKQEEDNPDNIHASFRKYFFRIRNVCQTYPWPSLNAIFLNVLYDFNHCFGVYIITKQSHPYFRLCVITVVTRILMFVFIKYSLNI